jgi:hypothetical protein
MVLTVSLSVALFGLLSAYLLMTSTSQTSTKAHVDSHNTFIAAESGLNMRAAKVKDIFVGYSRPSGNVPKKLLTDGTAQILQPLISNEYQPDGVTIKNTYSQLRPTNAEINQVMQQCIQGSAADKGTKDFQCRGDRNAVSTSGSSLTAAQIDANENARYNFQSQWQDIKSSGSGSNTVTTQERRTSNYTAYSFMLDRTRYKNGEQPPLEMVTSDSIYRGLMAQTYHYTVYASAFDRDTNINTSANTVLQSDFKVRIVPLFQFGVFYDGDLDISGFSDFNVYGRVHTNKTLIIDPDEDKNITFVGPQSTAGDSTLQHGITVAGDIYTKDHANDNDDYGKIRITMPSSSSTQTGTVSAPDGRSIDYKTLKTPMTTPLNNYGTDPSYKLSTFEPFIRNRFSTPPILPLNPPPLGFLRRTDSTGDIGEYYGKADLRLTLQPDRAVPFDLTTIQTGTGAKGGTCTGAMSLSPNRQEKSTAKCQSLSKGQLNSIRQPVLVLTKNNTEETDRFCKQTGWNDIGTVTPNATINGLSTTARDRVLRALQVAIASSPTPVPYRSVVTTGTLPPTVQTTFKNLLDRLKLIDPSLTFNSTTISQLPPSTIAATRGSCFLPAPIQRLVNPTTGKRTFFDRRENREMRLLQTNIESLTVWNRDGVYVDFDADLTTNTSLPTAGDINAAFDDIISAAPSTYTTDGILFLRDVAVTTANTGSFQKLGLAAKDRTEGGFIFHATLDDATYPIDTDNFRIYNASAANKAKHQSPFGLVVTGGKNLPAPLTIATDLGIYLQGDYNNYGLVSTASPGAKQPAAIMADTVTILSNNCMSNANSAGSIDSSITDGVALGIDWGQVNCLVNEFHHRADTTRVYAAFAARNDASCGNLGSSAPAAYCARRRFQEGLGSGTPFYGGGLQNSIRMLEDWDWGGTQRTFTYRGSMVSLGVPQEFEGPIVYGNVYDTPVRDYGFDPSFSTVDLLPPLTPRAISLEQNLFRRMF